MLDQHGFRPFTVSRDRVYAFIAGFVMAAIWSALLLGCAAVPAHAQVALAPVVPALPRSVPSVAMPATARVLTVAAGGNFQAALDSAQYGDAIELARGATFAGAFILPAKGACSPSTGWIVIRPAAGPALPSSGTRLTPSVATALQLPVIRSVDAGNAIQTALGACHYRLVGVEVTLGTAVTQSYGLVGFGMDEVQGQTTLATTAHDLVLDRVYVHGTATATLRRCVLLNSGSAVVVDSWLSDCHDDSADAQAIMGCNGPGPFLIQNNELQGSTENIMFGGCDAAIPELTPADITIRRNHVYKPAAWIGSPWHIKNLFELKNAQRVLVEENVMEGSWPRDWDGTAIAMKSANQGCGPVPAGTLDVTFRRNVIRHTGSGINLDAGSSCGGPIVTMARVLVSQNLVLGLGEPQYAGSGRGFFTGNNLTDVTLDHNTVTWQAGGVGILMDGFDRPTVRFTVTNNLFATVGGHGLLGTATGYAGPTATHYIPDGRVAGNVFAVGVQFSPGWWNTYPAGNRMVVNDDTLYAAIGFVRGPTADIRLAPTSPHKGFATDGTDPGADVDAVLAATAGVVEGVPSSAAPIPAPTPIPAPPTSVVLPDGGCWRAVRAIPACVSDATALQLVHGGPLWRATPTGVVVLVAAGDSVTLRAEVVRRTLFVAPAGGPTATPHVDAVVAGTPLGRRTVTLSLGGRTGHADVLVVP